MKKTSKSMAIAYAKALIVMSVSLIIALEIFSAYLLRHHSVTYARTSRQYEEALKTRPAGPGEPLCVLMVGNSLLLHGVELDRLRALTSPSMRIYPVFLEATGYYYCLYALQRLFPQRAKPQALLSGLLLHSFLNTPPHP